MAYQKTNWATGDVVTAEKLNNIESGIEDVGGGVLMVHVNFDETIGVPSLDKTWQEIYDAVEADKIVALKMMENLQEENYDEYTVGYLIGIMQVSEFSEYYVRFLHNGEFVECVANDPNEYPVPADYEDSGSGSGDELAT